MNATTKKKLKNLVKQAVAGPPPGEDEFTVKDWMEESGLGLSATSNKLKQMEKDGILTCRWGTVNCRNARIYKLV
jgi:hypothetical protein